MATAAPPLRQVGITLETALQPEQILHHLPFAGRCPSFRQQSLQHRVYIAAEAGDNLERQACTAAEWHHGSVGRALPTQQPQTHSSSGVQSPLVLICSNQGSQCNYPGWLIRAPTGLVWRTEPLSRGLGHRRRWGWGLEQEGMGMHEAADSFRHLGTAEIRLWPFSHCLYTFFRSPRCLRSDLARKKT